MDPIQIISLTLGAAWASGVNLDAAVLVLRYLGVTGNIVLPAELQVLTNPLVFGAAGLMYVIEFFADKIPGVDSGWDVIHTFIRIPAGAALAAGMAQGLEINQGAEFAATLVGGGIAATSHAAKTGTRLLINTSPEPVTNWSASIAEDIAVVGGLWASLQYPWVFMAVLALFLLLLTWLMPKIWGALKRTFRSLRNIFKGRRLPDTEPQSTNGIKVELLRTLYQDSAEKDR